MTTESDLGTRRDRLKQEHIPDQRRAIDADLAWRVRSYTACVVELEVRAVNLAMVQ